MSDARPPMFFSAESLAVIRDAEYRFGAAARRKALALAELDGRDTVTGGDARAAVAGSPATDPDATPKDRP